ncbi:hypothetical protein D187_005959 [Cystobacter fuscus DSM 2262]|uniref:Luciferase domain-containing protein n=1 Tax=Cystobacter fuscus (strain ATCC 25194 / DSM 2262 / NBRC 100088 / M29) TaxID=1242864 RepID=S9PM69_CYSF2|nr:luciferase family protein [Cystobacter fuscus]EPX63552.1 hypothetical protein D187_005959 [Cystobacter fuscus DSM 2262]
MARKLRGRRTAPRPSRAASPLAGGWHTSGPSPRALPGSALSLPLPEPLRSKAIASGWAEKHPLTGYPSVSRDIVMVYAPRDPAEIEVVTTLVTASWRYARGSA